VNREDVKREKVSMGTRVLDCHTPAGLMVPDQREYRHIGCRGQTLGNVLSSTDARGFTTVFDRNELGEIYRVTSPAPYYYKVETYYDANRNVVRVDTEDQQVAYESGDPTDPFYAQFMPSGNGMSGLGVAQVPTPPGPRGTLRPGWFSNLYTFDLLDNKTSRDIDATGSDPASLVTTFEYDPNQNLVTIVKPEGNLVEFDYDERNLRIAQRVGYVSSTEPGAVTIWIFDPNGNLIDMIGPADRTGNPGTVLTATIADAFRSEIPLAHTGDWVLQNTLDGFNRVTQATDAIGNVTLNTYDPGSRVVQVVLNGPIGGASPTDRTGSGNVTLASAESRFDEGGRAYESHRTSSWPPA
jgi:YD repeat-containing protein